MFDAAQEKKETGSNRMWIGLFVVVAVALVGALWYTMSKTPAKSEAPVAAAVAAPGTSDTDAVRDLKVMSATMDKDSAGTTAVWLVDIVNKSKKYTYTDIKYETTYLGPGDKVLLVNQGTISANLEPGEERKAETRDALYPAGTALYKIRVTGGKATIQ